MNAWEGCIIATIELLDPGGSETAGPNSILIYREVATRLPESLANSVYLGNARNSVYCFFLGGRFREDLGFCREDRALARHKLLDGAQAANYV